jgi:alpha-D-xyloside xylohydrolase
MFYDGLKEVGEEEIISLTRAAYPGSQRYGAVVWNGDIPSTFEALKVSVKSGLSMAMSGIPWWNSDIGGFLFGDIDSDYFRELIVRWFQFGLFCPVMRLHGARLKNKDYKPRNPGIIEPSGGNNEIWCFGEENYPVLKKIIELRERMKPYTKKYMDIASKTGKPIMRPMFFDYYEDEICYTLDDQYMYGDDILFAPIVNQGEEQRKVYLPEGKWVNVFERKTYQGGQFVDCHAKLHEFIAFVKEGSEAVSIFDIL